MSDMSGTRGVDRVLAKLERSVNEGKYYEAHQMYRTLYFRYFLIIELCGVFYLSLKVSETEQINHSHRLTVTDSEGTGRPPDHRWYQVKSAPEKTVPTNSAPINTKLAPNANEVGP